MAANAGYASPTADARFAPRLDQVTVGGIVSTTLDRLTPMSLLVTILLGLIVYDQCE